MINRKRKARIANLIGKIFIIVLFLVLIVNVIVPDKEKSELENRTLESRPRFNLTTVLSGDFMEQWEKYLSDQFAGRNTWRRVKVGLDRLGGAKMENNIYIGKGGQLMENIEVPDEDQLDANMTAIQNFAQTYEDIPVTMMLVPDAACILTDRLPAFAEVEDQRQMFSMAERKLGDSVNWIDTVSILNKHKSEKLYYKTDHHWTTQGAFYVFQDAAQTFGIEGDVSDDFVSYTVTDSFNGVLAASSGDYVDEGRKTTSLYDSSKLDTRDKYGVFLGGNTSVIDIKTVSTSQKRLLIVKDSFADCFIPFLAPYYREIVVVDPRYYSGTMDEIMDTYRITDALILYSGNTFFTDNNISGVFSGE